MTAFLLPPPPQAAAPVEGGGLFPVRRIFCVGRNYAAHAREMGSDPTREPPFFFAKPADALVVDGADTPFPTATAELHHEVELVVALKEGGADIPAEAALEKIFGYAVGLDLTRRDLQAAAKAKGHPWDMAKGFDASAPLGLIHRAETTGHPVRGKVSLTVNGALRQNGDLDELIWSIPEVIASLSKLVRLAPGDLIYTGTPAGVGPLARGDVLVGAVEGVGEVRTRIV